MSLPNEIVLRPRFKIDLDRSNQEALKSFEDAKTTQSKFSITRIDDHVFIKRPRHEQQFWSPQLDLEIIAHSDNHSVVHGLFGPKPAVWTMFMFLHFVVAGLFIGFGIWAYTNWSLGYDYMVQLAITLLTVLIWFVLYFAGRMGKASGKDEILELYNFMKQILNI
ncbi:MAG: GTP-binding protein [Flavobacteriaceae bacterium]|nr:GTP-binding protein [Flavobacteriaceae bacterium]